MGTLLLNKPYGVLCQFTDRAGRTTLADYVPVEGVYPAGRLDQDSEGLVVLTSEGWLQARITEPRSHWAKTYWAQVEGIPDPEALRRAIELSATKYCTVTFNLSAGVTEIQHSYVLRDAAGEEHFGTVLVTGPHAAVPEAIATPGT